MNILHTISSFHPQSAAGGPVYGAYATAKGLLDNGHKVSVYSFDRLDLDSKVKDLKWHHGISSSFYWDAIKVKYIKSYHPGYGGYGTLFSHYYPAFIKDTIQYFDVIHIHGTWNFLNATTVLMANIYHVPYVVQLWNTYPIRLHRVPLKKIFHKAIRSPWLNHASAIVALTPDEKREYLNARPKDEDKTHIIPTIMPTFSSPRKGIFRDKWNIPSNKYILLFLGRLHSGKGIEHLVEALQYLNRRDVILVVVGPDAGFEKTIRQLVFELKVSDQVLFTGPIYGEDKFTAFADADVYVLPSLFEQLPISAMEAALSELPLIISDNCGITDLVRNSNAGIVVPYNSPTTLAEAVNYILQDPNRRQSIGKNAKLMVNNCCHPDIIVKKVESLYHQVSINHRTS